MQLKGQVLGYDYIATFELSDVIGSYKEDDVLYIQTSIGETPIVYSSIEPVSPIQEKGANRDLPPPEEWEFDEDAFYEDTAAKEAIQEGEQEREPDRSEINDFSLRAQASEEMGCTCDACLNIIRPENEKSRPYPNRAKE